MRIDTYFVFKISDNSFIHKYNETIIYSAFVLIEDREIEIDDSDFFWIKFSKKFISFYGVPKIEHLFQDFEVIVRVSDNYFKKY